MHPKNNGAGGFSDELYTRVLIDGVEARCMQVGETKNLLANEIATMVFVGTIKVNANSKIQLQYYVTDVNIDFEGSGVFDDGVAASINLERMSRK